MEQEIIKADDLEAITAELGGNMAMEKAVIHDHVVKDNAYETAMQTSDLLLKIGYNLISNLNGQKYNTQLENACGLAVCSSSLAVSNGEILIHVSHNKKECKNIEYQLNIHPKKNRISMKVKDEISGLKSAGAFFGTVGGIAGGVLIFPASALLGAGMALVSLFTGLFLGIPYSQTNEYAFHKRLNPEKLFRQPYVLDRTEDKINAFLDDYCSLPGRVYSAVEHWITQNQNVNIKLDQRKKEYALLEEKLR